MLGPKRVELANQVIADFLADKKEYPTIASINEGGCGEFADGLNRVYKQNGLSDHSFMSTFSFMPLDVETGYCEYMEEWDEIEMMKIGVPSGYFARYRQMVEQRDRFGTVGYHVWLYDGEHHYDATCLEGVRNPLELPFFKIFLNGGKLM